MTWVKLWSYAPGYPMNVRLREAWALQDEGGKSWVHVVGPTDTGLVYVNLLFGNMDQAIYNNRDDAMRAGEQAYEEHLRQRMARAVEVSLVSGDDDTA